MSDRIYAIMEILFSVRRSVLLVVLVLLLGFLESVESATPELPLLPPIDVAQQSSSTAGSETPQSQVELLMIRLIRTFFGDQVVSLQHLTCALYDRLQSSLLFGHTRQNGGFQSAKIVMFTYPEL